MEEQERASLYDGVQPGVDIWATTPFVFNYDTYLRWEKSMRDHGPAQYPTDEVIVVSPDVYECMKGKKATHGAVINCYLKVYGKKNKRNDANAAR